MPRILVGTSGWNYPSWKPLLYEGVPKRRWLAHAATQFDALEVNGSFYGQIKTETYERWAEEVPDDFCFAVKGHRYITHYKRWKDAGASVDRVMEPALALGAKLSVVLWQMPADFARNDERLDEFLGYLAPWTACRHAIELRHRSWFVPEVASRLSAAGVASCLSDAPDFPLWDAVTTDLVYVRLHGHTRKYRSSYATQSLLRWADAARRWQREGRQVQIYFDNDAEGAAVRNARALRQILDSPRRAHASRG